MALVQVNGLARSLQAVGSDMSPAHSPAGSSGLILAMAVLRSRAGIACTATMADRQPITERGRSPVPTRTQSRLYGVFEPLFVGVENLRPAGPAHHYRSHASSCRARLRRPPAGPADRRARPPGIGQPGQARKIHPRLAPGLRGARSPLGHERAPPGTITISPSSRRMFSACARRPATGCRPVASTGHGQSSGQARWQTRQPRRRDRSTGRWQSRRIRSCTR